MCSEAEYDSDEAQAVHPLALARAPEIGRQFRKRRGSTGDTEAMARALAGGGASRMQRAGAVGAPTAFRCAVLCCAEPC